MMGRLEARHGYYFDKIQHIQRINFLLCGLKAIRDYLLTIICGAEQTKVGILRARDSFIGFLTCHSSSLNAISFVMLQYDIDVCPQSVSLLLLPWFRYYLRPIIINLHIE